MLKNSPFPFYTQAYETPELPSQQLRRDTRWVWGRQQEQLSAPHTLADDCSVTNEGPCRVTDFFFSSSPHSQKCKNVLLVHAFKSFYPNYQVFIVFIAETSFLYININYIYLHVNRTHLHQFQVYLHYYRRKEIWYSFSGKKKKKSILTAVSSPPRHSKISPWTSYWK